MADTRYEPGPPTEPGFYRMRDEVWDYFVYVRVYSYPDTRFEEDKDGCLMADVYDGFGNVLTKSIRAKKFSKSATYRRI